ncbi:MAG: response regulator [Anaerolineales bacterium]
MMPKILLIEDIHDNAALVKKLLVSSNYDFLWAENAETGLTMAIDHCPDLILLDLGLPDVDGQTLSVWLRNEPSLKDVPIIAITAWPIETVYRMVKEYGLDGYIGKPFKTADFLKTIRSFFS